MHNGLAWLKVQLKGCRKQNIQRKMFLPDLLLYQMITVDNVQNALEDIGIAPYQRHEISAEIVRNGRKIFAILVLTDQAGDVRKFIEIDELNDAKLPFKLEHLRDEIGVSDFNDFEERQWEVLAPSFQLGTLNRRFRDEIVLPFVNEEPIGKGAFGTVQSIQLIQSHQELGNMFPAQFVRKKLEDVDDHGVERENLAILNHLKHPNVVQLLSSFTHQNIHSLLFPLAKGGTLEQLLYGKRMTQAFQSDITFLAALADLASAVDHVHNFFAQRIDVEFIGCHHDLRPRNILISDTSLVLADFGIARFKRPAQDSMTPFRGAADDYIAPECEDWDECFEPMKMRRSSDIWSFGCIILEISKFIEGGANAVKLFQQEREVKVRSFVLRTFHHGPDRPSPAVQACLLLLKQSSVQSCAILAQLAERMLSIDQSMRPRAREVTYCLRLIAISCISTRIQDLFRTINTKTDSFDIAIEHVRFRAWCYALGVQRVDIDTSLCRSQQGSSCNIEFASILQQLNLIQEDLGVKASQGKELAINHTQISFFNNNLLDLLPSSKQELCRDYFRILVIDTSSDHLIEQILHDHNLKNSIFLEKEIRLRMALKHMTKLASGNAEAEGSDLQVPSKLVRLKQRFGDHRLGSIMTNGQERSVLIEWRKYGKQNADEKVMEQLFQRINAIARQLSLEKPESMRTLRCSGYFHDPNQPALGLVFEIPEATPCNLQNLIVDTGVSIKRSPVLDDKFKLAAMLARSLLDFHLVGWLHKNLRSENIVFFRPSDGTDTNIRITEPYVIGFNISRQDDEFAFSELLTSPDFIGYQHPSYRERPQRYRHEYDYYSLGIILMEIAFWKPFKTLANYDGESYSANHDLKLQSRVPTLQQCMGRDYYEAVKTCVEGDFDRTGGLNNSDGNNRGSLFVQFENKVVRRLEKFLS